MMGIANAYMDSTPIVVITGQVPKHLIGTDAFQEVDTVGITRPCVKHNYLVREAKDLAAIVREAFYLARSGRPGPVVIDIPKDITAARSNYSRLDHVSFPFSTQTPSVDPDLAREAVQQIVDAKRPVLYVGGGIVNSGAVNSLLAFADSLRLPVTPTLMGLGGFPSSHPLCLGMLGMHGTYAANMSVAESDLRRLPLRARHAGASLCRWWRMSATGGWQCRDAAARSLQLGRRAECHVRLLHLGR